MTTEKLSTPALSRDFYTAFILFFLMLTNTFCAEIGKVQTAIPQPNRLFFCKDLGQVVYTNTKINKDCKDFVLSHSPPPQQIQSPSSVSQSPATFPKVSDATQKARDVDRKRILEDEMSAEQKNLERAKKELAQNEAKPPAEEKNRKEYTEHIQTLKDKVFQHERNIQALRKEMGILK